MSVNRALAVWFCVAGLFLVLPFRPCAQEYVRVRARVPDPAREMRAVWITTVNNACWPSRPGLSTDQQKKELLAILDAAVQFRFNTVILQVRPACDAFYASELEPWSEYLTGVSGRAPEPFYDPLAFVVEEAHKRGLELHAWFNPFRARHHTSTSEPAPRHITRTRPELVRKYGRYLWLDPGEPAARTHSLQVILDVVTRYDVDGIVFDDYFYPYPESGPDGRKLDFPDYTTWRRYGAGLSRADWRRENVNSFIRSVRDSIVRVKPWVKFGVSPFGIWRPGHPPSTRGLDAYAELYADARLWLRQGWVDYLAPQLYWRSDSPGQNFAALLKWWAEQNVRHRHLFVGLNTIKVLDGWPAAEITNQIGIARRVGGATGQFHFDARILWNTNVQAVAGVLQRVYGSPALVPALTWRAGSRPAAPTVELVTNGRNVELVLRPGASGRLAWWLVQTGDGTNWSVRLVPAQARRITLGRAAPVLIAVRAVDRFGLLSEPVVYRRPTRR